MGILFVCISLIFSFAVRRLYDVANIFAAIGIIAKKRVPGARKPGFVWCRDSPLLCGDEEFFTYHARGGGRADGERDDDDEDDACGEDDDGYVVLVFFSFILDADLSFLFFLFE